MFKNRLIAGILLSMLVGCSNEKSELKLAHLTQEQAMEDFNTLASSVKNLYGPLEYKERRFGFKFEELVEKTRAEIKLGKTDIDYLSAMKKFMATFEDGHVSFDFPGVADRVTRYSAGIYLTPVEGKAVIAKTISDGLLLEHGLSVGDVVLSIDGKPTMEYLDVINQYEASGNDISDQHNIYLALNRPAYIKELKPTKATVTIEVESEKNGTFLVDIPWEKSNESFAKDKVVSLDILNPQMKIPFAKKFNKYAKGSYLEFGAKNPYFVTQSVKMLYGLNEVAPNKESLEKFGVEYKDVFDEEGNFVIYAAVYEYEGQKILLIRQPSYVPALDFNLMIAAYKALLSQYQPLVDRLVIDQNHNPGGMLLYVTSFYRLFLEPGEQVPGFVQRYNADRKWYYNFKTSGDQLSSYNTLINGQPSSFTTNNLYQWASFVEDAIDTNAELTTGFGLYDKYRYRAHDDFSWTKPVMLLADELAGSCGDILPMLMKRNKTAKLFGQKTMGLGGNVERFGPLPFSGATYSLTRGLFTTFNPSGDYSDADAVENNGVTPDVVYSPTLEDYRNDFTEYFGKMSAEAIKDSDYPVQQTDE